MVLREAIILCPGPSLANHPDITGDYIIGINRAAILRKCTHWIALDWISDCPGSGIINWADKVQVSPTLITSTDSKGSLLRKGFKWPTQIIEIEQSWKIMDHIRHRFSLFSATAAIVYAAYSGASKIDIYGMDMRGNQDADGLIAGSNRTEDRWRMESAIVENLISEFDKRGIEITRK